MGNRKKIRTAQEVIDQAIAENKTGEYLLYGLAVSLVLMGFVIIVWAISTKAVAFAAVGAFITSLFWPAVNCIRQTRVESVSTRLLEFVLSRADTSKEAAGMLQHLFHEILTNKTHKDSQAIMQKAAQG